MLWLLYKDPLRNWLELSCFVIFKLLFVPELAFTTGGGVSLNVS